MEKLNGNERSPELLFAELSDLEPKPVASFHPSNAEEQRDLFLSGQIENPRHTYDVLNSVLYLKVHHGK
jgi:hypothetical protein